LGKIVEYLVSANWLQVHLDGPDLVILDCTNFTDYTPQTDSFFTTSGRQAWEIEHIIGSRHADFTDGLSHEICQYRNALPDPLKLTATLEQLGIGDGSRVILYDSASSMWAARVWWMLRWIGFDNAAVLDGGLQNWKATGGDTTSVVSQHQQTSLSSRLRTELFITTEAVVKALGDTTTKIVDALAQAQFDGSESILGLRGHIPGAVNVPAESLLDPNTGCYLSKNRLCELLPANHDARTIVYCGSGIAAASVAFSMCRIGFTNVAIYMPGFQKWMHDASLPQSKKPEGKTFD